MRGYAAIGLHNPKTAINIGSAFRAAGNYDAALVVIAGPRRWNHLGAVPTDTMKAYKRVPVVRVEDVMEGCPLGAIPIAVDFIEGAESLVTFQHPQNAYYIFGPEDGTLGKTIHSRCKSIIYVPTNRSMNLAACVNVVLYDRLAKA